VGFLPEQRVDPLRVRRREQIRDHAAEGVSDQRDPVEPQAVEKAEEVIPHQLQGVSAGPGTAPVPAKIGYVRPPLVGQVGEQTGPGARRSK
jgi:hypothetical protein